MLGQPGDQQAEGNQHDDVAEDIDHGASARREALIEQVDPHMRIAVQGVGATEERQQTEQVPLQLGDGIDGDRGAEQQHVGRPPVGDFIDAQGVERDGGEHGQDDRQTQPAGQATHPQPQADQRSAQGVTHRPALCPPGRKAGVGHWALPSSALSACFMAIGCGMACSSYHSSISAACFISES